MDKNQYFSISQEDIGENLIYIPTSLDSAENGVIWHRARFFDPDKGWKFSFYASDSQNVVIQGKTIDLDEYLSSHPSLKNDDPVVNGEFWGEEYNNPLDVLLFGYKGRFMWVKGERTHTGVTLGKLRLYYPAYSFVRYLPIIYQKSGYDGFLPRFLALFQSLYVDLEEKIDEFPQHLSPEKAAPETQSIIAQWLGCEEFFLLPEDRRGEFLLECVELYKSFGTRQCLEKVMTSLCGETPYIAEYVEYSELLPQTRLRRHFGKDMFTFNLIVWENGLLPLIKVMADKLKPSHTECNIIEMKKMVVLDEHTYMGVNSHLI